MTSLLTNAHGCPALNLWKRRVGLNFVTIAVPLTNIGLHDAQSPSDVLLIIISDLLRIMSNYFVIKQCCALSMFKFNTLFRTNFGPEYLIEAVKNVFVLFIFFILVKNPN